MAKALSMVLSFLSVLLVGACGSSSDSGGEKPLPYNQTLYDTHRIATVEYGSSQDIALTTRTHSMDIYMPPAEDSNDKRPLIIYAHGGYFLRGDKDEAGGETTLGSFFARSGYVLASINYRLAPSSSTIRAISAGRLATRLNMADLTPFASRSTDILLTVAAIDAMSDMRAAIRYFLADSYHTNTYKVDLNNVMVMGFSAGAFTALNTGLVDSVDDLPANLEGLSALPTDFSANYLTSRGGVKGDNDSNRNYSTTNDVTIRAIVNLAGAIPSTSMIKADAPAIFSLAGDIDPIVPVNRGIVGGIGSVVIVYGAEAISRAAIQVNVISAVHLYGGIGHDLWDCADGGTQCNNINTTVRQLLSEVITQ